MHLATTDSGNALLDRDPLALLIGMLLDQQIPMEKAFTSPAVLRDRLGGIDPTGIDPSGDDATGAGATGDDATGAGASGGEGGDLDATVIAELAPERLEELFRTPPALHRFPGAMARRVQELCRALVREHGGRAEAVWADATSGSELLRRLAALPGFGDQKARIFVALLGKQRGVQPPGWREAAGPYGEQDCHRSVADVVDAGSLLAVRAEKQRVKREKAGAAS